MMTATAAAAAATTRAKVLNEKKKSKSIYILCLKCAMWCASRQMLSPHFAFNFNFHPTIWYQILTNIFQLASLCRTVIHVAEKILSSVAMRCDSFGSSNSAAVRAVQAEKKNKGLLTWSNRRTSTWSSAFSKTSWNLCVLCLSAEGGRCVTLVKNSGASSVRQCEWVTVSTDSIPISYMYINSNVLSFMWHTATHTSPHLTVHICRFQRKRPFDTFAPRKGNVLKNSFCSRHFAFIHFVTQRSSDIIPIYWLLLHNTTCDIQLCVELNGLFMPMNKCQSQKNNAQGMTSEQ